jgi:brefeldin A-inhibited guanine nucleotide-exchange protein
VYNVFLLGRAGTVQTVAQATLGQIVGGVFGRVKLGEVLPKEVVAEVGLGVEGVNSLRNNASRTDLESVKEEERNEEVPTEEPQAEKEGEENGIVEEKPQEEEEKEGTVNGEETKEDKSDTPRVSVSQEDEKPKVSVGEKITT